MTEAASAIPLFGERQDSIPGLAQAGRAIRGPRPLIRRDSPSQLPLMMPVRDPEVEPVSAPHAIPGQLTLGPNQLELSDSQPEPVQLSFLDEPQPWEESASRPPTQRTGRLARRRARAGISPGQIPLF